MKKLLEDRRGLVIVEAVYVFPIMILITLAMYFLAMYTSTRVMLQSSLEWALTQVASDISDASVTYDYPTWGTETQLLNPYRHIFPEVSSEDEQMLKTSVGNKAQVNFFPLGGQLVMDIREVNMLVYKELRGSACLTVKMPINLSFVGLPSEVRLEASAKQMVNDRDELIRNMDIAFDIVEYVDERYDISGKLGEVFKNTQELVARFLRNE